MTMDNEWKNSLRERFSDYSAPEPEGLWEGIEQGIAGKPRRKMLPVWIVSGVAVAAAVTLAVFLHPERTVEKPVVDSVDRYVQSMPADMPASADTVGTEPSDMDVPARPEASQPVPFAVTSRQTLLSATTSVPSVPVSDETVPDAVHEVVPVVETPVSETAVPEITLLKPWYPKRRMPFRRMLKTRSRKYLKILTTRKIFPNFRRRPDHLGNASASAPAGKGDRPHSSSPRGMA